MKTGRTGGWSVWVGTAFMLSGLAVICVGTGAIPVDPASLRAPGWVISLCGAVLVLAGLMAFVEIVGDDFVDPLAVVFILSFATVAAWVAVGSGDGSFYGSVSLGPSEARGGVRELISRLVFGIAALTLVALAAGIFARWVSSRQAGPEA